jgi:hypothetical protein
MWENGWISFSIEKNTTQTQFLLLYTHNTDHLWHQTCGGFTPAPADPSREVSNPNQFSGTTSPEVTLDPTGWGLTLKTNSTSSDAGHKIHVVFICASDPPDQL